MGNQQTAEKGDTLNPVGEQITETLIKPKTLHLDHVPEGYLSCKGYGSNVHKLNWFPLIVLFPGWIVLLVISAILPIVGLLWCIFKKRRTPQRKKNHYCRLLLLLLLIILFLLLIFFLFHTFAAFLSYSQLKSGKAKNEAKSERLSLTETNYSANILSTFSENVDQLQKKVMKLPTDFKFQSLQMIPKALQEFNLSYTQKLLKKKNEMQPLLVDMSTEVEELLVDVTELVDYARFYYYNTTSLLNMSGIDPSTYQKIMLNDLEKNSKRVAALLSTYNVIKNINEILEVSDLAYDLREGLSNVVNDLRENFLQHLNKVWLQNENELKTLSGNLSTVLSRSINGGSEELNLMLPSIMDYVSYAFLAVVILLLILILVFLCLALGTECKAKTTKKANKALLIVIWSICITAAFLGVTSILYFCFGVLIENFQKYTAAKCTNPSSAYCQMHINVTDALDKHIHGHKADEHDEATYNILDELLHTYEIVLSTVLPDHSQIQKLMKEVNYMDGIFRDGSMSTALMNVLDMKHFYKGHVLLCDYVDTAEDPGKKKAPLTKWEHLLSCNVRRSKNYLFDKLINNHTIPRLYRLEYLSKQLALRMPGEYAYFIPALLREINELETFYKKSFEKKLSRAVATMLKTYRSGWRILMKDVPRCEQMRLMEMGIKPEKNSNLLRAVNGFWLGGLVIVILLLLVFIVCICLHRFYGRRCPAIPTTESTITFTAPDLHQNKFPKTIRMNQSRFWVLPAHNLSQCSTCNNSLQSMDQNRELKSCLAMTKLMPKLCGQKASEPNPCTSKPNQKASGSDHCTSKPDQKTSAPKVQFAS